MEGIEAPQTCIELPDPIPRQSKMLSCNGKACKKMAIQGDRRPGRWFKCNFSHLGPGFNSMNEVQWGQIFILYKNEL